MSRPAPRVAVLCLSLAVAGCAIHPPDPPLAEGRDPVAAAAMDSAADAERRLLARDPAGGWIDAAPLAGLLAKAPASCARTRDGTACAIAAPIARGGTYHRSLAATDDGRCVALWGGETLGGGTIPAVMTLHRRAGWTAERFERLYFFLNSGRPLDATPRLTDPSRFARYCLTMLQPDRTVEEDGQD